MQAQAHAAVREHAVKKVYNNVNQRANVTR